MKSAPDDNPAHALPATIGPHPPAFGQGKCRPRFHLAQWAMLSAIPLFAIATPTRAERLIAADPPSHVQPNRTAAEMRMPQNTPLDLDVEDITGAPGEAVPMKIKIPPDALTDSGLVMIRGVPEALSFAPGFKTGRTWMVSFKELNALKVMVPENYQGAFDIEVTFVVGASNRRENRTASVTIAPTVAAAPEPEPDVRPTAVDVTPAATGAIDAPRDLAPEVEESMLERAGGLVSNGDVAAARLLYEHLASRGSSLAALSLARTYDPAILPGLGVIGMRPDRAAARRWYERAASMGSKPAAARLEALTAAAR
jgi:hypothetical protein